MNTCPRLARKRLFSLPEAVCSIVCCANSNVAIFDPRPGSIYTAKPLPKPAASLRIFCILPKIPGYAVFAWCTARAIALPKAARYLKPKSINGCATFPPCSPSALPSPKTVAWVLYMSCYAASHKINGGKHSVVRWLGHRVSAGHPTLNPPCRKTRISCGISNTSHISKVAICRTDVFAVRTIKIRDFKKTPFSIKIGLTLPILFRASPTSFST